MLHPRSPRCSFNVSGAIIVGGDGPLAVLGLCLFMIMSSSPPATECTDIAKSLTKLLDNYKDATYLPRDVHFGLNLAYKLLSVLKSISDNSEAWQRRVKYRHLDIAKPKDTFSAYEWIVDMGQPTARESDECMSQLGATKTCVISSKCVSMMISREPAYGYHKTHQLLFLFLTLLKHCSLLIPHNQSIDGIIAQKCSDIYTEQMILLQGGIPSEYRDLFMEQSLFCAVMGFSEFLAMSHLKPILLWQSGNGCFTSRDEQNGNQSGIECKNHINSLGLTIYSNILLQFF